MDKRIDQIILNAKSISGGRSLGDNEPVKMIELERLEKDILKVSSGIVRETAKKQRFSAELHFKTEVIKGRLISLSSYRTW